MLQLIVSVGHVKCHTFSNIPKDKQKRYVKEKGSNVYNGYLSLI